MKLFVTDLDKTFLKSDLSIGEFSNKVWNKRVEEGYMLSIATARSLKKSLEFFDGLALEFPLILLDGAMVAKSNGEIVRLNAIEQTLAEEIVEFGREDGIEPFIVGFDDDMKHERFLYPNALNEFQQQLVSAYKNDSRLRASAKMQPLYKNLKIVYMGTKEKMLQLERKLKARFQNKIEIKNAADVYFDCWFLTVLHPLGDKAHALGELLEHTGVGADELSVFGDSHNDIGMFKLAGRSIAVKNALEDVKRYADIVLPHTNDEEGVAHYLASLER